MARRKQNKKLTLVEILEKKKVILTALAKASETNLFLQASNDAFNGAFNDCYAPSHFDPSALADEDIIIAG